MSTITTRAGKGSPLTNAEVDSNFENLNTDKAELSGAAFTGAITTTSTVDGRDVATDGSKLDGIEAGADVTDTANVTAAGALMDSELTAIASVKALNQGVATTDSPTFAGLTTSADISFGDNDKAVFGAGSDLQIYHDGSNSYIKDQGTGNLNIQTNGVGVVIADTSASDLAVFNAGSGQVTLYNSGLLKLATTSTGIDVTGTATMDGGSISGNLLVGASSASAKLTVGTFGDTARAAQFHGGSILLDGGAASEIIIGDGNVAYMSIQTTDNATAMKIRNYSGSADLVTIERASGNVGIGNTSAPSRLTVKSPDNTLATNIAQFDSLNGGAGFKFGYQRIEQIGATTPITFETGGSESMRIDSSGNITQTGANSADFLIKAPTDNASLTLQAGSSDTGAEGAFVNFLQNTTYKWQMGMDTDNGFRWYNYAASSEVMRIDSSGNLLVGKTTDAFGTAGIALRGTVADFTRDGGTPINVNRLTSDGSLIDFHKAGTVVGSIGTLSGTMYIGNGDCNLLFTGASDAILPVGTNGATKDGQLDLGSSGNRFKDLYLSGGVVFGTTGGSVTSKTLDDYEEGTWTPTNAGNLVINSIVNARYTKVGDIVTVTAWLKTNPSSTTFIISGLPFSSAGRSPASLSDVSNAITISSQIVGVNIYGYGGSTSGTNNDFFISATYHV